MEAKVGPALVDNTSIQVWWLDSCIPLTIASYIQGMYSWWHFGDTYDLEKNEFSLRALSICLNGAVIIWSVQSWITKHTYKRPKDTPSLLKEGKSVNSFILLKDGLAPQDENEVEDNSHGFSECLF